MNRSPTPGGVFATNFVGERWYFTECSLDISLVFATLSQSVRSRRGPIYRARIYVYTHKMTNGNVCVMMWKCVFNNVKTRI